MASLQLQQRSAAAQLQSPFGRLPTEIRLIIYEHVFTCQGVVVMRRRNTLFNRTPPRIDVLLTCRTVLYEAEPLFYRLNRFLFDVHYGPQNEWFLGSLNPDRLHAIEQVCLHGALHKTMDANMTAHLKVLHHLPNLQSVHLMLDDFDILIMLRMPAMPRWLQRVEQWAASTDHLKEVLLVSDCSQPLHAMTGGLFGELVDGKVVVYDERCNEYLLARS